MVTDGRKHFMDYITFAYREIQWFSMLFACSVVCFNIQDFRYLAYNDHIDTVDKSFFTWLLLPICFAYILTCFVPLETAKKDEARNALGDQLNPVEGASRATDINGEDMDDEEDWQVDY